MALIEMEKATFAYDDQPVFKDIDLQVDEGDIFCLFGPNGCGKSTLIHCLLGIARLNSGTVRLCGKDINKMKREEIARVLAYIPQLHEKPFPFKVIDVVLMGRASHKGFFSTPKASDLAVAEEALAKVGLLKYKDRPYTQISGGETQLVLVARALAQKTPVLVMDEPTSHLDFRNELKFLETIAQLAEETRITVIMATHFPNHAFYFETGNSKTKIALMNNQRFTVQGSPSEVLNEANMLQTFNIKSAVVNFPWESGHVKQIVPLKTL
ncbi:MAG TPA: ABC transporter ATP-binding protein [Bacillota bacterium]|nr:ABC transporter ATP-binding protein [Bacillota bacterium]HOP69981.1 ABC transporter ATP-binding protein [Bacillota bacterium]HPZ64086.1 ABC transporter ATP-binding protein [Bacillota bacterium]HQD06109.1 ABC transporter ATP-binding protein [Bacillota bacterium]